ncbi:MAG: ISAs1 family transposase [Bryobacterales bacterium]|nr:ISAs1 family transposase [Bryobacterales bacterium]
MKANAIPLREVQVRTVRPAEEERWNELMRQHHYLGFRKLCGNRLRQIAVHGERWLGLLGWQSAALHCAARDRWIGWTSLQRQQRLFLVVNQSRFLLLSAAGQHPGLASRVLGQSLRQLPREWQRRHGAPLLLAETFVDPRFFDGTCYRAANWIEVGRTQGFGRVRGGAIGYQPHGVPKRVLVYPLQPDAAAQLAAERAPAHWQAHRPVITLKPDQWRSLRAFLDQVSDGRSRRGLRYPLSTALTLLIAGRLAGCQTLTELCDFGRALSQETLAQIGSRRRPQSGRDEAPGISSWHYIIKQVDSAQVEDLMAAWVAEQVPEMQADSADGEPPVQAVAMDGKVLRGSYDRDLGAAGRPLDKRAQQQVSALDLASGLVIGQRGFSGLKDEAEGVTLRELATQLQPGTCVIADALHTDRGTAQHLLDHGLDFILTVKDNQPTVLDEVREGFHWQCITPHTSAGCEHGRIERRSIRVSDELDPAVPYISFPGVRFVAQVERGVEYKKDGRKRKPETVYLLTSLPSELATAERLLQLNRTYWGIENRVHWVRDVALREDASRLRKGALPRLWAACANLVISILRLLRVPGIKRTMNQLHLRPDSAVQLLLG